MGFRFSRRLTILPGVHLNLGLGGISLSLGGRGASINIGKRGVFGNVGLPGTGLSYRERLGGNADDTNSSVGERPVAPPAPPPLPDDFTVSLGARGAVFLDANGVPLSDEIVGRLRENRSPEILRSLNDIAGKNSALFADLRGVCVPLPSPLPPENMPLQSGMLPPKPVRPDSPEEAGLDNSERARREIALQDYMQRLSAWRVQEARAKQHDEPDLEAMAMPVLTRLERLNWPRETNISLDMDAAGETMILQADLPEIEDFPAVLIDADQAALDLRMQQLSLAQVQQIYCQHVHGIVLRLVAEAFAGHGAIGAVQVNAYTQRATAGTISDTYVLSCKVQRHQWDEAGLWRIESPDPIISLQLFELRREFDANGQLAAISPH